MICTLDLPVTELVHIAEYLHLLLSPSPLLTDHESDLRKSTSTHNHAPQTIITKHIKQSCHHAVNLSVYGTDPPLHDRPILIPAATGETDFHKLFT